MKPTSIIFLGVSIAIMILGLVICSNAQSQADKSGIKIFNSEIKESGDTVFSYDFSEDAIRKISVDTLGADVNIIGTDGNSHIEIINFSDNSYTFSKSNKILSVTNASNIFSMLQFGTGNISFDGLRHYFRGGISSEAEKVINIYINPEKDLRAITVSLESGDLSMKALGFDCDYNISVSNGHSDIKDVSTVGRVDLSGSYSDFYLSGLSCGTLSSDQHEGGLSTENLSVNEKLSVKTDNGDINIHSVRPLTDYFAKISTGAGNVTIYGNSYDYGYNDAPDDASTINFIVKAVTGNIAIS